ncbi:MAG TPA: hypothetical protein VF406_03775 [Thermodesulfobacteriota bacterium]
MRSGATQEKLEAIERFRESPLFDGRERAALEMAEAMTITGREVDDALFARVREHFSEPAAVELAAVIALENFRSKLNRALGVDAQGFCAWRPQAPADASTPRP